MTIDLEVERDATLLDIEALISRLDVLLGSDIAVALPRSLGPQLFKDSRVAALFATAARSSRFVLRDWIQEDGWSPSSAVDALSKRLEGLAGLMYCGGVSAIRGQAVRSPEDSVLANALIRNRGVIEGIPADSGSAERGKHSYVSLTVCGFDDLVPQPLALGSMHSRDAFVNEFLDVLYRYLGRALALTRDVSDPDRELASFVYELFQNSYQHGRLDENGRVIRGLRYIRLRKHLDYDAERFAERAAGFPELATYLHTIGNQIGAPIFYELSISDHGLGLIRRFLATRPDITLSNETSAGRVELVNRIIGEALSSKRNQPGAGHGLERALDAVNALNGFVSLRTDKVWLCHAARISGGNTHEFAPVQFSELSPIAGTHFNLLFPTQR